MKPIVHGLEEKYRGWVTFLYLDIRDPRNTAAKTRLGYRATPHFFVLASTGDVLADSSGVMSPVGFDAWLSAALVRE